MRVSHIIKLLSNEPVTKNFPSGENCTDVTESECPVRLDTRANVRGSQRPTVPSADPETKVDETQKFCAGENAKDVTMSEWPFSVAIGSPEFGSQSRTVLSPDADASTELSGENRTDRTQSE